MIYCGRKRTQGIIIVNAWLNDKEEWQRLFFSNLAE
jgi:hypothetical protein